MPTKIDKSILNNINKKNIINVIREHDVIYKAEIARMTDLSIPTVMKITDEFISNGLVQTVGKGESTGGKPPQLLQFVADARHIIGVDIGTTNISVLIINLAAQIKIKHTIPTDPSRDFAVIMTQVIEAVASILSQQTETEAENILGIGVGVAGLISSAEGKVLFSPDFGWRQQDIKKPLYDAFRLPVFVDNVTRAMAMGELWFGLGQDVNDFLCINLGYGIGAAIVIDNEVYSGRRGLSGEFGHMTMDKNGPKCDCGNYGCLEALSSANAMSKQARTAIQSGAHSTISLVVNGDLEKIDAKVIFECAQAGDALANNIVNQAIEYLGIAIASAVNFLDPQLIILEGGVSRAGEALQLPLTQEVERHVMPFREHSVNIMTSHLGSDAAAIGAAAFLLKNLVEHGGKIQLSE